MICYRYLKRNRTLKFVNKIQDGRRYHGNGGIFSDFLKIISHSNDYLLFICNIIALGSILTNLGSGSAPLLNNNKDKPSQVKITNNQEVSGKFKTKFISTTCVHLIQEDSSLFVNSFCITTSFSILYLKNVTSVTTIVTSVTNHFMTTKFYFQDFKWKIISMLYFDMLQIYNKKIFALLWETS